ncbi:MAG TPA: cytochrome c [Pyrinomonadaceae bacterium]|nr:cytochrome c [Pyrinomonadaceae bacterium]
MLLDMTLPAVAKAAPGRRTPRCNVKLFAILRQPPGYKPVRVRESMKGYIFALLIVAISLFALACNKSDTVTVTHNGPTPELSPAAATPDQFAGARVTFNKSCSKCHGEDGSGGLKEVDGKKLKMPNLREGHALNHPDDDFIKQINKGGDGMPAFKDKLTPEQITDLVRMIRHDFQGK